MRFLLSDLRKSLDNIDIAIVVLLAERFRITEKVGRLKAKENLPAQDKAREKEKLKELSQVAKAHGLSSSVVKKLYRIIFEEVVKRHERIRREK